MQRTLMYMAVLTPVIGLIEFQPCQQTIGHCKEFASQEEINPVQ